MAGDFAWSPDGKTLAVAFSGSSQEPRAIFLASLETGEKRRLTTPQAGSSGDGSPAFSPDGKLLAFIRSPNFLISDIYLVPIGGGEPERITHDNLVLSGNLAWSPNGREIIFSSPRGGLPGLWKVNPFGGDPRRVIGIGE